jgi:hypothetical protein
VWRHREEGEDVFGDAGADMKIEKDAYAGLAFAFAFERDDSLAEESGAPTVELDLNRQAKNRKAL